MKEFSCDGRLEDDGSTACYAIAQLGKANSGILGCTSRVGGDADKAVIRRWTQMCRGDSSLALGTRYRGKQFWKAAKLRRMLCLYLK